MMGQRRLGLEASRVSTAGLPPATAATLTRMPTSSVPCHLSILLVPPAEQQRLGLQHQLQQQLFLAQAAPQPSPMGTLFDLDLGPQGPSFGPQSDLPGLGPADRSLSDLDSYRLLRASCGNLTEIDQLIQLCCPTSDIELAVAEHLRHVRNMPGTTRGDTGELAAQLLAMGLLVQVRQGAGSSEPSARAGRDCLRSLRHTFMVCTGYQRGGEPMLFREPIVVEPRFKEQFVIAQPTPDYEQLLQVLPVSFVGSARRLEGAVRLLADQVALAFRQAGRSLPPWRTAEAMMSKWAPGQLSELTKLMRSTATAQTQHGTAQASAAYADVPIAGLQPVNTAADPHEHAAAMELVRSMSRQMSSTGMCAHSLPETQAAFMKADSLRRSICGVQGGAMPLFSFGSRSSLTMTAGGGAVVSPTESRESGATAAGALVSPARTQSDATAVAAAAATAEVTPVHGKRVSTAVSAAGNVVPATESGRIKSAFLNAAQDLTGELSTGAAAGQAQEPQAGTGSPAVREKRLTMMRSGGPGLATADAGVGHMTPIPEPSQLTMAMDDYTAQQALPGEDAISSPTDSNTLRIVRQSSSDLKQAVKHARGNTRSALAAALKAVAAAPAPAEQQQQAVLVGSGTGPVPGVRLGVRKVGAEDVWPPRITTVKWGAQGR